MRVSVLKLGVGVVVAAVVLVLVARTRGPVSDVKLVDQAQARELWTLARQLETRGLEMPEPTGTSTHIVREPLDVERARNFFPIGGNSVFDPHMYFRKVGGLAMTMPQPDYPGGTWHLHTNAAGFREDQESSAQRPDVFVLVAGDSHTEGVCDNADSYSNRLEAMLAKAHQGRSVEVLNTGCASYTFYNYLGVLDAFADRKPDVFVTAVFSGNDFLECLPLYHYFHRTQFAPVNRDEWARFSGVLSMGESTLVQGMSSAAYFSRFPDQVDCALQSALEVADEIRRRCDELGIAWIFVYIPSVFDLADSEAAEQRSKAQALMQLKDADVQSGNRLGDRLLRALRERGVEVVDLRDHFTAAGRPWYWMEYHMNLKAQARVAELLLPLVEARLATR